MKKSPSEMDRHIGRRIRTRRIAIGMSQEKLGDALGLTFQQVQKYEKGTNRVGAGRLVEVAQALEVPVQYFYEGLSEPLNATSSVERAFGKIITTAEGVRLLEAFATVDDLHIQRKIVDLVELVLSLKGAGAGSTNR